MSQVTDIGLTIPLPHIYHLCNREVIGITIGHHLYVAGIAEQTYRITFCHPLYVAIVAEHTYLYMYLSPFVRHQY